MTGLEIAAIAATLISAGVSAYSSVQQGSNQKKMAKYQASQMEHQADQEKAAAQRRMAHKRRQTSLLESEALAAAGASGMGTLDPGVLDLIGGIQREGELAAQSELYNAEAGASVAGAQAGAIRAEGSAAKTAGYVEAGATALGTIGSLGSRYGDRLSPKTTTPTGFGQSGTIGYNQDRLAASSRSGRWNS